MYFGCTLDFTVTLCASCRRQDQRIHGRLKDDAAETCTNASDEAQRLNARVSETALLHQETEVLGTFAIDEEQAVIVWQPLAKTKAWLENNADPAFRQFAPAWRPARLVLYGSRIWAKGDPGRLLDGDLACDPTQKAGVAYPSGDGARGGDLVFHFRLGEDDSEPVDLNLELILVDDGPMTRELPGAARMSLARALRMGIDRPALTAAAASVPGLSIGTTRAKPAQARAALNEAGLVDGEITVMARASHGAMLDALVEQFERQGLKIIPRVTTAANATRAFKRAVARGVVDAVLVDPSVESALAVDSTLAPKLTTATVL